MKTILILFVLIAAGCQSAPQPAAPTEPPLKAESQDDFARLYLVSLGVLSERFPIASAEEAKGLIETQYLIGPWSMTSPKVNYATASDAFYETLHTTRRRAILAISHDPAAPISLEVERGRFVRVSSDSLPRGTYSLDVTQSVDERSAVGRWVDEGRDHALEERILSEIIARYDAGAS